MRFRDFARTTALFLATTGGASALFSSGCLIYNESLLEPTGTGGSGGSSTSSGQTCSGPEECPQPSSPCQERACTNGQCAINNLAPNTELSDPTPGDCHGLVCDSAGGEIEVELSKDFVDDKNPCTIDACMLGEPTHQPEVGKACGDGNTDLCNPEGNCVECLVNDDCAFKVCKNYACAPASCNDGIKNGAESDTDCGGGCQNCPTGKACKVNTDCKGGLCQSMVCQPTCTDGLKNNAETDVDCGGPMCSDCADGKTCASDADCTSLICSNTKCAAPTCVDGKKNGTETGIDCGGSVCSTCPLDHLVINEVDYDQDNTDTLEFVEIFNATTASVSLANLKLVLVDGSQNVPYSVIDLTPGGTLAAGQYLVVGTSAVMAAAGAVKINFTGTMNQIQNGAPDGVALVDDAANKVLDVLSYEGAITTANLSSLGIGTVSLVEGSALNAAVDDETTGSLCRLPNGKDVNSASADWKFSATPTPGAANVP